MNLLIKSQKITFINNIGFLRTIPSRTYAKLYKKQSALRVLQRSHGSVLPNNPCQMGDLSKKG